MYMKALWTVMVGVILTFASCGITASLAPRLDNGVINLWWGVPGTIVTWILWAVYSGRSHEQAFNSKLSKIGIKSDYSYKINGTGFVIDRDKSKIGIILSNESYSLDFSKVTAVRSIDEPRGRSMSYKLCIETSDFDSPEIIFPAFNSRDRDVAYQKLRVALGFA